MRWPQQTVLSVLDDFGHECMAIRISRRFRAVDVIGILSDLFILRSVPSCIRSDNRPEFMAKALQKWIATVAAKAAYIKSFNARLSVRPGTFGVG